MDGGSGVVSGLGVVGVAGVVTAVVRRVLAEGALVLSLLVRRVLVPLPALSLRTVLLSARPLPALLPLLDLEVTRFFSLLQKRFKCIFQNKTQ